MRLFIGLRPSEEFRAALAELQARLRAAGITGRYLEPDNLHMTLAFIGEWPEADPGLLPAVDRPFLLTLSHLGIFPEAKVLWAGTDSSSQLDALAEQVRGNLAEAEIPFDRKRFYPHITLARKPAVPEGIVLSEIVIPRAEMIVKDVCWYRSDRGESGMIYTVIGSSRKEREESDELICNRGSAPSFSVPAESSGTASGAGLEGS